jgi:cytochrome c oxidase assembly factor 1
MVRDNGELKDMLGDAIRPEPAWYLNGDPWINGSVITTTHFCSIHSISFFLCFQINLPQGNVDLSFRLKGHRGSGTLYFTSIRKAKGEPFTPREYLSLRS